MKKRITLLIAAALLTVIGAQATTSKTKVADVSTWTWAVDGSNIPTLSDNTMTFVDGTGLGISGLSYAVADYDYLVVKVTGASAAADFTIDDNATGQWGRYHVTIPASNDVQYIKIPLGANTPQFNDGAVRAFSTIKRMWFKGAAAATLTVSEIYLVKDDATAVSSHEAKKAVPLSISATEGSSYSTTGIFTTSGKNKKFYLWSDETGVAVTDGMTVSLTLGTSSVTSGNERVKFVISNTEEVAVWWPDMSSPITISSTSDNNDIKGLIGKTVKAVYIDTDANGESKALCYNITGGSVLGQTLCLSNTWWNADDRPTATFYSAICTATGNYNHPINFGSGVIDITNYTGIKFEFGAEVPTGWSSYIKYNSGENNPSIAGVTEFTHTFPAGITSIEELNIWNAADIRTSVNVSGLYLTRTEDYQLVRTIAADSYGTICLPFAASKPDNATVYEVVGYAETSGSPSALYLEAVDAMVAGKAYVFKCNSGTSVTFEKSSEDLTLNLTSPAAATNLIGVFSAAEYVPVNSYILVSNQWKKVTVANRNSFMNYRAYLTLTDDLKVTTATARQMGYFEMDVAGGQTTAIETVNREPLTVNQYYDLSGRRVSQPTKGIYVKNGKKVVIK